MLKVEAELLLFGQLAEITGKTSIKINGVSNTDDLVAGLHQLFPALAQASYVIAVDQEIVKQNTALRPNAIIALLPPFSGG